MVSPRRGRGSMARVTALPSFMEPRRYRTCAAERIFRAGVCLAGQGSPNSRRSITMRKNHKALFIAAVAAAALTTPALAQDDRYPVEPNATAVELGTGAVAG